MTTGDTDQPLPDETWATIVEHVPLVSVDLIVKHDGGIVLGLRENEPAKGEWFVPGGTVLKNERLTDAVDRVAREELGTTVSIEERLGTYEHLYDTSEIDGVDSKHYLANAFVVRLYSDELTPNEQHSELRVFRPPFNDAEHHPYVRRYLKTIED